ncbi:uncharacterized protein BCR38DRAFT_343644, partial [Pseudomassariella vexata]
WVFRKPKKRYREHLANRQSYRCLRILKIVFGMIWLGNDEVGASKLVFCDVDPDSPHYRLSSQSY